MRIATISFIFVAALCLFAGCKDQASQPVTSKTENTINSTTVQSSDSELLKYEKEKDAKAEENWKKALKTDKLENRKRETGKAY